MKIFLTGAAGYIGAAVGRALRARGHSVVGLTHSPEKKAALEARGIVPLVGDIKRPDSYKKEAAACDVLIHAAFEYGPRAMEADGAAVETLIAAAREAGAPRLLVYTSGVWVLGHKGEAAADEQSTLKPLPVVAWRPAHEQRVLSAASSGMRAAVLRPGCVYGGRGGLYGQWLEAFDQGGEARLAGDGTNCWATVNLDDLAALYALVAEAKPERAIFHATDGSTEPVKMSAQALAAACGKGRVVTVPLDEARAQWGPIADALAVDQRVSSERAKRELGWKADGAGVSARAVECARQWRESKA